MHLIKGTYFFNPYALNHAYTGWAQSAHLYGKVFRGTIGAARDIFFHNPYNMTVGNLKLMWQHRQAEHLTSTQLRAAHYAAGIAAFGCGLLSTALILYVVSLGVLNPQKITTWLLEMGKIGYKFLIRPMNGVIDYIIYGLEWIRDLLLMARKYAWEHLILPVLREVLDHLFFILNRIR